MLFMIGAAFATCIGDPATGWGCRREFAGHRVLDLHGDDARIGELYGALLGPELRDAYAPMMELMYDELPANFRRSWLGYRGRFPARFDAGMRARAAAVEQGAGLPEGSMDRYAWFSELSSVGPALRVALGGCTSVIGRDGAATVHARNVDFWGMGFWQPHATILAVDPRGDGHRYVQVSDVGEIFAGTTGFNERGLVVTTHVRLTADVPPLDGREKLGPLEVWWRMSTSPRRSELSVYRVMETLLRRASDVSEATGLARTMRSVGAWSFVISDPGGGRAVVEMDARAVAVNDGASVTTNFALDEAMYARELRPARGVVDGARLRYQRAVALLGDGDLPVEKAVALLRDRFDSATGRERPASANSVLSPDATQSVVIVTPPGGAPTLWVAEPDPGGYFPSALAPFHAIPFEALFGPCVGECVTGTVPYEPQALDAGTRHYLAAMAALVDRHDVAGAIEELRRVVDPGAGLMRAWLEASSGGTPSVPEGEGEHHRSLAAVLRGDLARRGGDEAAARAAWTEGLAHARGDALVTGALAARLRSGPGRRWRAAEPDLKFQDVFDLR